MQVQPWNIYLLEEMQTSLIKHRINRLTVRNVDRQYTLRVDVRANKHQIRQAVEELFPKVKVASVNTSRVNGKTKRARTRVAGRTSDWKKAVITLKEGEIELL